jgi:RNA polymerase sigma-32 factor
MASTLSFPVPSAVGSIDSYIQAVNRFPMLTLEQEQAYARSLRDNNDLDAAQHMVLSHLRLVVSVARNYLGYGLPHADLIQEGNIGLMKAVKRFDPDRGVRLVSFAIHWIKAEIHEYILKNWRMVKIATTKAQRKLFFNLRSMKPGLDTLTHDQVNGMAAKLGVKPEEVVEMETRLTGQDIALDAGSDDDDERFAPIGYLTDADAEPSRMLEAEQWDQVRHSGLETALNDLDPRSRRIVQARWLNEKNPATLHDLAAEFKVSAERIRQIEQKAMQKMRGQLAAVAN